MNTEYILDKEEIEKINKKNGGTSRNDAEIETALFLGKGKSIYRKIALLWKAIITNHPFTDGNKRTAYVVAIMIMKKSGIQIDKKTKNLLVNQIIEIATEEIRDVKKIERKMRYAMERNRKTDERR